MPREHRLRWSSASARCCRCACVRDRRDPPRSLWRRSGATRTGAVKPPRQGQHRRHRVLLHRRRPMTRSARRSRPRCDDLRGVQVWRVSLSDSESDPCASSLESASSWQLCRPCAQRNGGRCRETKEGPEEAESAEASGTATAGTAADRTRRSAAATAQSAGNSGHAAQSRSTTAPQEEEGTGAIDAQDTSGTGGRASCTAAPCCSLIPLSRRSHYDHKTQSDER